MKKLIDLKSPRERFARSINVERDSGTSAIDGYLPVGRAIESVERLAEALLSSGEVALSITGPYGSGKSSLALVLDSLFASGTDPARASADRMLSDAAPEAMAKVHAARKSAGAERRGFIRAVVTAQRESAARTVIRALHHGLSRYPVPAKHRVSASAIVARLEELSQGLDSGAFAIDTRQVREIVRQIQEIGPILLLIDEFGKNLEAFAEAPGESDLFLLQELAEWTRAGHRHRMAVVTLQHMAFGDYADTASAAQRREWMKIQGRFEDIPFVDTPGQTRALIAAAFEPADPVLAKPLARWTSHHAKRLAELGITELADNRRLLTDSWPLHPLSLAVLPDLCHRYGQNERTMFSFLASREPNSVGRFLADARHRPKDELQSVTLDRVYDYFIESAANMVGVSADASRWIEIDTRIRDSYGLPDAELRVLKVIGLLNLVSTGGSLRASAPLVAYAACDGQQGSATVEEVAALIHSLEERGLITYRDFADEFRVWQGSDFDLKAALDQARRRLRDEPPDKLLQRVLPLRPVVAARHSHTTGTLRAFERRWVDHLGEVQPLSGADRGDGLFAYVVGGSFKGVTAAGPDDKPIVLAESDASALIEAAREVLVIDEVLAIEESIRQDWVVRKELSERRVAALIDARREFELAFGPQANVRWRWTNPSSDDEVSSSITTGAVALVASKVADQCYHRAIPVFNDLMNRHELSSQAAKARREVVEIMAAREGQDALGLQGFGPNKTLYLSLLREFELHSLTKDGWAFTAPPEGSAASPVWRAMVGEIRRALTYRVNVASVFEQLAMPPHGLRAGIAPVLLVAVLRVHADEFALYEHGTFRPRLSGDVCERLLRNPGNFELKCFGTRGKARAEFVAQMADRLRQPSNLSNSRPSVVGVVSALVARINGLPVYAKKTRELSDVAVRIRSALLSATEPDELLFQSLPAAVGFDPVRPRDRRNSAQYSRMARAVADGVAELEGATPRLKSHIREVLTSQLRAEGDVQQSLARRSIELKEKLLDPRLKALATALHAEMPEEDWLSYVAMQVVGTPPDGWTDEEAHRFDVTMHDLGAAFLRVEALTADMRALGGEFEALRLAVNSSRGGDLVRLVPVDPARSQTVEDALGPALEGLTKNGIGHDEARDWILAHLLEHELTRSGEQSVGAGKYGRADDGKEQLA